MVTERPGGKRYLSEPRPYKALISTHSICKNRNFRTETNPQGKACFFQKNRFSERQEKSSAVHFMRQKTVRATRELFFSQLTQVECVVCRNNKSF